MTEKCPTDELKWFVSMYCFTDSYDPENLTLVCCIISAVFLVAGLILFLKSNRLKSEIVSPDLNADFDETYCSLSLSIVNFTRIMLALTLILLVMNLVFTISGENFAK